MSNLRQDKWKVSVLYDQKNSTEQDEFEITEGEKDAIHRRMCDDSEKYLYFDDAEEHTHYYRKKHVRGVDVIKE